MQQANVDREPNENTRSRYDRWKWMHRQRYQAQTRLVTVLRSTRISIVYRTDNGTRFTFQRGDPVRSRVGRKKNESNFNRSYAMSWKLVSGWRVNENSSFSISSRDLYGFEILRIVREKRHFYNSAMDNLLNCTFTKRFLSWRQEKSCIFRGFMAKSWRHALGDF